MNENLLLGTNSSFGLTLQWCWSQLVWFFVFLNEDFLCKIHNVRKYSLVFFLWFGNCKTFSL